MENNKKLVKLHWFNDTNMEHHIYFKHLYLQDRLAVVKPQEMVLLQFELKDNENPVIKQWPNGNAIIWGKADEPGIV